jgi:type 1 glutamine amidotransferase
LSKSSDGTTDGGQGSAADGGQGTGPDGSGSDAATDSGGQDSGAEASLPALVLLYHFSTTTIPTPVQQAFYKNVLAGWGYGSEDSVDPAKFTDVNLGRYAAVVMNNTCFWPFGQNKDGSQEAMALQRFLARGGGLFGTHCASVTDSGVTSLYRQLLGGHGGNGNFDGTSSCRKIGDHPTIAQLPTQFSFMGNLDNTDFIAPTTTVAVMCKWGAGAMLDVAVSWYRSEGAGRIFYTNFGKVDSDLSDPVLGGKHIVPGLAWVLRRN